MSCGGGGRNTSQAPQRGQRHSAAATLQLCQCATHGSQNGVGSRPAHEPETQGGSEGRRVGSGRSARARRHDQWCAPAQVDGGNVNEATSVRAGLSTGTGPGCRRCGRRRGAAGRRRYQRSVGCRVGEGGGTRRHIEASGIQQPPRCSSASVRRMAARMESAADRHTNLRHKGGAKGDASAAVAQHARGDTTNGAHLPRLTAGRKGSWM